VLSDAVDALARAGATVIEGWPDGVDPGQSSESFGFHVGLFFAFQHPGEDLPPLGAVIEQENRRMAVRAAWSDYFERNDVFVCPTNFTPAFPHDARPFDERTIPTPDGERPYAQQPFWIAHASLPGLPAVATPVGRTPGGLPVGVQILGPAV
jgi:amidase